MPALSVRRGKVKEPSRLLLSFLIFPFFPLFPDFPLFFQFLAIFFLSGVALCPPHTPQWPRHWITNEFNLLASGKDIPNACSINDCALNSKTWEGETWKASQGNPLKFTMCTLLDQRFSKYIKIRICHFDQISDLQVAIHSVCFLQIFPGGQNGGLGNLGGIKWKLCQVEGMEPFLDFSRGVDLASLVV